MQKNNVFRATIGLALVAPLSLALSGCGQNSPQATNRQYVMQVLKVAESTIARQHLSGMDAQRVARSYFQFGKEVKSIRTEGVSEELVTSAHGWADACAMLAQAMDDAVSLPGEGAATADGLARLILGERPREVYERASRYQADNDRAMRAVYSAGDAVELRKGDFQRAVHNHGIK